MSRGDLARHFEINQPVECNRKHDMLNYDRKLSNKHELHESLLGAENSRVNKGIYLRL